MEREGSCPICGENATQKCAACEKVFYCGRDHQKKDWRKHAEVCRAFKIAMDPKLGRHYVALRNIKPGEIILNEETALVEGPMYNSLPVCLSCYTVLNATIAVPCQKCGWPLCRNCENEEHGSECGFTCSRRDSKVSITEFGFPHPSYQCINVIRALNLKKTDPESYEHLLSFENHLDTMKNEENYVFENPLNVVHFIKRFFRVEDFSEAEISKIVGVLQVNGHEVPITEPPYMAVYNRASFFEHSCRANCSKSFTENGGIVVHAAVPISKGEHISICYTDPLWGSVNRRHHLARTKFFECCCDRCKDPTEFGTMFNALKCDNSKCSGYLLPITFLEEEMNYECNKCESKMSWKKAEEILENIGKDLSEMRKNDVKACKDFLNRYKNILHPNHFYNVDILIAFGQLIGQEIGGLQMINDNLLTEKIEVCKRVDNLLKTLAPGENRIRGLILFELHAALAEFSRRQNPTRTIKLLTESKKCLEDSYILLKLEPEVLPEGKIAIRALRNLQEMNSILKNLKLNPGNTIA